MENDWPGMSLDEPANVKEAWPGVGVDDPENVTYSTEAWPGVGVEDAGDKGVQSPEEASTEWPGIAAEEQTNPYAGLSPEEADEVYRRALRLRDRGALGAIGQGLKQAGLGLLKGLDKAVSLYEDAGMYGREDMAGEVFAPVAEEMSKDQQRVSGAAFADQRGNRAVEGATRSIGQAAGLAYLGVPLIPGFAALRASDAQDEAEEAGLEGLDKARYIGTSALIEGGLTAAFQKVGLGGFEKYFGTGAVAPKGIRAFAKEIGVQGVAEVLEENAVEIADSMNQKLSGVQEGETDWRNLLLDTTLQTLLAFGVGAAPKGGLRQLQVNQFDKQQAADLIEKFGFEQEEAREVLDKAWEGNTKDEGDFFARLGQQVAKKSAEKVEAMQREEAARRAPEAPSLPSVEPSNETAEEEAWREQVNAPVVDARKKLLETVAAQKLSEIDHPIARFQSKVLKNRYRKNGGKWGVAKEGMDEDVWNQIPQQFRNNKNGYSVEEVAELLDIAEGEQRDELGLGADLTGNDVLRLLSIPKTNPETGEPNFIPEELAREMQEMERYFQPELDRDLMESQPVQEVLNRMDPNASPDAPPMLVRPSDMEDGDIIRIGQDLYEVQQRGDIKVLQDGTTIPLDEIGQGQIPVDGVVPSGHSMHGELVQAYTAFHQAMETGISEQQEATPPQGGELIIDEFADFPASDEADIQSPEPEAETVSDVRNAADPNMVDEFVEFPSADDAPREQYNSGARVGAESSARLEVPDWTKQSGESKEGVKLVNSAASTGKQAAGVADIVEFVNKQVRVEMRRSKSQTTRRNTAHYRPVGHLAMTRNTQSQINFHEAGHGLKELLVDRMGGEGFFKDPGVRNALLRLTKLPGSMASAENVHEGVAEWMRLKVVNPAKIEGTTIDTRMESAMREYLPDVLPAVRDAARAYNRFMNQPAAQRWATFNKDQKQAPTLKEAWNVVMRQGQKFVEGVASGAPVSRLDRQFARKTMKAYRENGDTLKVAAEKMRKARKRTKDLIEGHNVLLQVGAETQLAYSGVGPSRGVRYIDRAGNVNVIHPKTWNEIIKSIPAQQYEQFEQAGWALESLNRHVQDGMEYPGFREGVSPDDLKGIVEKARKDIPNFDKHFAEVQSYFDALLELRERSGMLAPGEKAKIQRREIYWPLPRVMNTPAGHRGAGTDLGTGLSRAYGSGEAIQDLNTVAEHYTRRAFSAVYWNQFAVQMFENLQAMAKDKSIPMEVRSAAGRVMIPLKMQQKKVAEVSKEWIVNQAYNAVARNIAEQTGESLKQVKEWFQPENLNLATEFQKIYRPGRPNDVNVLSFMRDGERQYVQVSDDALFMGFAKGKELSAFWKGAQWLLRPTIENWKRNITQSLPFAVNNLMGDVINQTMMNQDKVGWFPGGATVLGIMNKFTKKYPQVFQEGLLLSRVQPTEKELLREMKQNAVMRFLTEGLYVSENPNKTVRLIQTVFQPANWLFPLFKTGDIVNLVTGGKALAPLLESATREGAAVATLQRGGTDREAMLSYWNVTGPFNEHSPSADLRAALAMPGFFNPQLQALRRAGQLLTDPDPAVAATAWTKLMVMVPAVFGSIAALRFAMMDDEEKDKERERPLDDRLNYHDVMGFRVRFPYGAEGAMASMVYNSVMDDLLDRKRVDANRRTVQLLKRIADAGSPTQFMGPQINTLQEASSNWSNYRQRHIVSPWLVNLPASEQYHTTTPKFYKKLGRWMDYSPAKIEYIVNQAFSRQVGEVVRILDGMQQNKPLQERADIPFVGRLFMRDPSGMSAQSVQDLAKVRDRLAQIDRQLNDKGWAWIKNVPYDQIRDRDLYALRVQLDQMETLRAATRQLPRYGQLAKAYSEGERWEEERQVRRAMVMHAQAAMAHNEQEMERLDIALELLSEIGEAPPEIREWDYRRRSGISE